MVAVDVGAVVGWLQDNDRTLAGINPGAPVYAFALTVSTLFAVIFLWGWWATHPRRARNRLKALTGDVDAALTALQAFMLARFDIHEKALEADRVYIALAVQLATLGVVLPHQNILAVAGRSDRWELLTQLVAHCAAGDIETARRLKARTSATT